MKAIIRLDVPDWQIGKKVSVYFPDSMVSNSICEIDNTEWIRDNLFKMRDATEEERKSTQDYINSISKPTGIQFDEVVEELNFVQEHPKIQTKLEVNNVAKWKKDYRIWKCSNCDASFDTWRHEIVYNNYCPNCGAKMEIEEISEVEE